MKTLLPAALAAAMFLSGAQASFAAQSEGVVASVDTETRIIVLEDGTSWTAAEGVDLSGIEAGDTIEITYDEGGSVATAVTEAAM